MAHSIVPKSTLEQVELPSKELIKFGIIKVHNNMDICQEFIKNDAYMNYINKYVEHFEEELKKENIFNVEIIQETIEIDEHTIMEKICIWCDKNEVDIVLIMGLPYHHSTKCLGYCPSAKKKMVTKTFENIIDKYAFKKYAAKYAPKIKEKLESKYHRVMCGERNGKLIINLFGMFDFTMNCLNMITTTLNYELKLYSAHNQKVMQDIASWSSEENDTNKTNLKKSFSLHEAIKQL